MYDAPDPMASYLVQLVIADLEFVESTGPGRPADPPRVRRRHRRRLWRADGPHREMIEVFDDLFGPYPFVAYGGVVVDDRSASRSRPRRCRSSAPTPRPARRSSPTSSPTSGSATPSAPRPGRTSGSTRASPPTPSGCGRSTRAPAARRVRRRRRRGSRARRAAGDPGADHAVRDRSTTGALTLHVLRETVGDDAFFTILQTWVERYGGGVGLDRRLRGAGRGDVGPGADRCSTPGCGRPRCRAWTTGSAEA